MAEQAQKQEAKAERPEVRRVHLTEPVIFPGAPLLGGADAKTEVDVESRLGVQRKVAVTLTDLGALVKYQADPKPTAEVPKPTSTERAAKLIPWRLIKGVDVSPEWKP